MSLPTVKEIRRAFPDARITLLALPWVSGLYEESEYVDEIMIYDRDRRHRGLRGRLRLVQELRKRGFDAAVLLQNAFEAALLSVLAGIPIRAGYSRDRRGWLLSHSIPLDPRILRLHQTYYYLDLFDRLLQRERRALQPVTSELTREDPSLPDISIQVSRARKESARESMESWGLDFSRKVIGVNPGAFYGSAKRWRTENYGKLLDQLIREQNAVVAIFGSPNEMPIAKEIEASMDGTPIVLTGKTRLSELIAMIACCDLFITNDSGPMHLAAALRIPTIAIFGPTDDVATGPLSPNALVLNKRVECSPCLLRECPIDHRCMVRISPEEVYLHAARILSNLSAR